ncbi:MAG: hypothetical protein H0U49_13115 [Parachlamydiaceae bacterium]|nr:hypothetical protein [Parachlamydiaceae bacterium]
MPIFDYALKDYSQVNPWLWGNFIEHAKEAQTGSLGKRTVHVIICATQFLPIISQIASLFERFLVLHFSALHQSKSLLTKNVTKSTSGENVDSQAIVGKLKTVPLPLSTSDKAAFQKVNSSNLIPLKGIVTREDFTESKNSGWWPFSSPFNPVIISKSEFVPKLMVEHLMRNKKDSATGVKYEKGDLITNMEGALHSFLTAICPITMSGDYTFTKTHSIAPLNGKGRNVILSTNIQPDFECNDESEVTMKLVEIKPNAIEGQELPNNFRPLINKNNQSQKIPAKNFQAYENSLQKHMVHHLTADHRLPALHEVQDITMSKAQTLKALEELINYKGDSLNLNACMKDAYLKLNSHTISLEALWNIYLHQMRNEFSALEQALPQGYVYTIDPPAIFAKQFGTENVDLLNRLQILAFKKLAQESQFNNLKAISFNDYNDQGATQLLKNVFPTVNVLPKATFFPNNHFDSLVPGSEWALVIHNNSDAFGQNIETEGASSLDGVIGSYSNAALQLLRNRGDLLKNMM